MSFFERHSKNQDKSGQAKEWFDIGKKHLENREYDSAIEAFTSAISIDSNYEDAYFYRAKSYGLTQQYDKVITDCNVVTAINPERTGSYIMRGITYSVKNQNDKAIEDYSKAISLDANISLTYLKRGKVYTSLEQYDKAIEDFNKLIALSPDSSKGYQVRGEAYILICKFTKAIDDFTKVIEITPDDAEALCSRGGAYACNGDNEKAVPDLIKACNMGHEAACEMLNKIENSDKENKNAISLNEVEPFNAPTVNDHQAEMFMKQLTGFETFEFEGAQRPKSILFYDLMYNYPEHSYAHGWLLSKDVDSFLNMCNSGEYDSMEPILKISVIGSISFEYGGNLTGTQLHARKSSL